jgi:hypothetical protein
MSKPAAPRQADREPKYQPFGAADGANGPPGPPGVPPVENVLLTPQDLFLFNEGSHLKLYE